MPTSTLQKFLADSFKFFGDIIESLPGYPVSATGPKILFYDSFETNRIIFSDTARFRLSKPLSGQDFRFSINDGSSRPGGSPVPDLIRRLIRIEGIETIAHETSDTFPVVTIVKSSMFRWDDILPRVRHVITHPEETLSESLAALGSSIGAMIDGMTSLTLGQEHPDVVCEYFPGENVAGDDDGRDRIYAHIPKRLLRQGCQTFDHDSEPGLFDPLARRLLDIEGVEKIAIYPYLIVIYIESWGTCECGCGEIEDAIRTFS